MGCATGDVLPRRPKVLYVMGAGRSGSTILGVVLGNCDDMFFAGELDKWLARAGEPKLRDPVRVEFWASVRARVADADALFGGQAHRYLERSSALFRAGRRRARGRLRAPYGRAMNELYAAIATTAGTSYVVDTSHYPLRARELQSLHGIDLYVVLLVRDPRAVVASFARDDVDERQFHPRTTRAYLLLTYLLSTWVFLRHPRERRLVLHYEDLLEDPDRVVREVLARVGASAAPPDFSSLATGRPLHGNRLLSAETVSLERGRPAGTQEHRGRLFAGAVLAVLGRLRPRVAVREGSGARDGVLGG
jgi:hypothetical protein